MPDAQAIEVVVMLLARLVNGSSTEARPVIRCTTSTRLSQIIGTALARSQLSARTLYLTNLFVHNKHFNFFVDVPLGSPVENGALYQARFLEDKPGGEEPCYLARMEISDRPDMRAGQLGANRGGGIVSKTRYVSLTVSRHFGTSSCYADYLGSFAGSRREGGDPLAQRDGTGDACDH